MKKYIKVIIAAAFVCFSVNPISAQTTILDQSFLTDASFSTFTNISVAGTQVWHQSSSYGAVCSGYTGGQNFENEDWLVSPAMDLSQAENITLTFSHTRGSASVMNVGVAEGWYKVFATSDFTGNPATTTWIELQAFNQNVTTAWQYISSGNLVIPEAARSATSRIAFRYYSSATQSATWEIKNVKVTGDIANTADFKITNWNTEWLGCTLYGPTDETLQINNVAAAILEMNSDIYCIQEVSNAVASPSISTLVSLLGSDVWDARIVPSSTDDCDQRQAIIYKKSKVQFISAAQLSSGNAAQGNSYYYNCANGRYPALYNVNFVAGSTLIPISLVNLHAKAEDGDASSYTRRLGASEALKTILDGAAYNSKNLIVIGDFNDYPIGTSSTACACSDSSYKNFIDDDTHYNCVTKTLTNASGWGNHPLIENIIISDELFGNYTANTTAQEVAVSQDIESYFSTTSDHLPVSATLHFSVLANQTFSAHEVPWAIYPNPVKDLLNFDVLELENNTAAIYDLTGRKMRCEKKNANTIDVAALPSGIYILKAGSRCGRFVKE